jgi:Na+-transporting NADH:ubiquinone oxidoreductase subunit NqrB
MFDKKNVRRQIETVRSTLDFRRSMMVLIALLVFVPIFWGIVSGGFRKGFDESMRDSGRRMSHMSQVLAKLKETGDEFNVVYKSSKSGQAFIDVRFERSE